MCGHRAAPVREAETGAKGKQVTRGGEKRERGVGVHGTEKNKGQIGSCTRYNRSNYLWKLVLSEKAMHLDWLGSKLR